MLLLVILNWRQNGTGHDYTLIPHYSLKCVYPFFKWVVRCERSHGVMKNTLAVVKTFVLEPLGMAQWVQVLDFKLDDWTSIS